jgi:hypothetical protein
MVAVACMVNGLPPDRHGAEIPAGEPTPDDGDALALTFAQPVAPPEVEEKDEEEEFGRFTGSSNAGWMR